MLQAVGGSMLNPVAMSIIVNTFTDRAERARAIGVWGGAVGVSLALGPVVGGLLIASVGWRGIFWVNIPVGVAAIVLTALFVPESKAPHPRRLDPVGQVLVIVTLASLIFGIIEGPGHGWGSPEIIGCFCLSAVALGRAAHVRAAAARAAAGPEVLPQRAVLGGHGDRGQRVRRAGRLPVPQHAVPAGRARVLGAARRAAHAAAGRGHGDLRAAVRADHQPAAARGSRSIVAGICMSGGALMLTRLTAQQSTGWLLASYVIFGIGFGVVNAPITNTAVSGMPRSQAGVAAAIASTSRQVGQSLGVAVVGSAVTSVMAGPLRTGFVSREPRGLVDHHRLRPDRADRGRGDQRPVGAADGRPDSGPADV